MWSDYNPLDQLVATYQGSAGHNEDAPRPSGLTKLRENTWDQLGRHTAETVLAFAAESRSYTWSGDDRLMSVKLGSASDAPVVKYTYDSSGTRVARSALPSSPGEDPEETRYLADYENLTGYSQILAKVGASEEDSRSFVYGQEHLPLAQLGGGSGAAFFHGDHLGTTRQLTGPAGDGLLASPANYSPFGDPETAALSSLTSMAYTGQHRDSDTDLQWHRARWLSTEKGRWLSEDPVFDFPANFGNRYGYVGGGPIHQMDVFGQFTYAELGSTVFITSLLAVSQLGFTSAYNAYFHNDLQYAGFDGFVTFLLDAAVAAFVAAVSAVVTAGISRAVAGPGAGPLPWKLELKSIFAGQVGASMVDYLSEIIKGRKFNALDMFYYILLKSIIGTISSFILIKALPGIPGMENSEELTNFPLEVAITSQFVDPFVGWMTREHIVEYATEFNLLWRASFGTPL